MGKQDLISHILQVLNNFTAPHAFFRFRTGTHSCPQNFFFFVQNSKATVNRSPTVLFSYSCSMTCKKKISLWTGYLSDQVFLYLEGIESSTQSSILWQKGNKGSNNIILKVYPPKILLHLRSTPLPHFHLFWKLDQDKTRQCFIWSLIQLYVHRLYPNDLKS